MRIHCIKIYALATAAALLLAGCGASKEAASLTRPFESGKASGTVNGIVAENNAYTLTWDNSESRISLTDKATGEVYNTAPVQTEEKLDDFGMPILLNPQVRSDIYVEYVDAKSNTLTSVNSSSGALDFGQVICESISNGLRVTYYFSDEKISVPVEYRLFDSGLSVSVDPSEIGENDNKVYSVSITPFACSVANDAENSYLFIPSGSGALAYPKAVSQAGLTYSQEVYGTDPTNEVWESDSTEQPIRLPVYGAKNGGRAICAVISSGAQSASIDALYGSTTLGYSSVYATFRIRGSSRIRTTMYSGKINETVKYSDEPIESVCTVDFYPLSGEDANYSGMAKTFRSAVLSAGYKTASKDSEMNLIIYGGIMTKKSFLGIPYESLYAATTVDEASEMVKELTEQTGASASVLLKGFGSTGLDAGKVGSGYKVGGNLGSMSKLNKLATYCTDNNVGLYFDFDLVRQSAASWFSFKNTSKSMNNQPVYQYQYHMALRSRVEESRYSLISRKSLTDGADKLIKKTENWELTGIGLETLGSIAYSDNSDTSYWVKGNMSEDVAEMMVMLHNSGKQIAVSSANLYAAQNADMIFDTPSGSTRNDIFTVDIPFYQMVFKGYVPISSSEVNLAGSRSDAVLKALEGGAGITYALYYRYDTVLTDSRYAVFNTGDYSALKQGIVDEVNSLKEYYESIEGAAIKEHTILSDGIRQTVFDNGTVIYVNYSDTEYSLSAGKVPAHGYLLQTP